MQSDAGGSWADGPMLAVAIVVGIISIAALVVSCFAWRTARQANRISTDTGNAQSAKREKLLSDAEAINAVLLLEVQKLHYLDGDAYPHIGQALGRIMSVRAEKGDPMDQIRSLRASVEHISYEQIRTAADLFVGRAESLCGYIENALNYARGANQMVGPDLQLRIEGYAVSRDKTGQPQVDLELALADLAKLVHLAQRGELKYGAAPDRKFSKFLRGRR